ncbi:transcriptional regulator domain-containing protein [Sphingomonas sp. LaA6.9]|uniref:transcriptional regulator domain-containing protein n=1 Tax=Sphingomonas sp. LaA6.9 TaxID=2919914 RepID=UPI00387EDA25
MWEWLRRDPHYRRALERARASAPHAAFHGNARVIDTSNGDQAAAHKWGLRFRRGCRSRCGCSADLLDR